MAVEELAPAVRMPPPLRRRVVDHPASKIAVIVLPALISGVVSTWKAQIEAKAKVQEAHIEAEAGYRITVEAMRKLEVRDAEKADRLARLEGQVQILANHIDHHTDAQVRPRRARAPEVPTTGASEALAVVKKAPPAPVNTMLFPVNLEQAVQWGKRSKE